MFMILRGYAAPLLPAALPSVAVLPDDNLRRAPKNPGELSSFVSVPAATNTDGLRAPDVTGFCSSSKCFPSCSKGFPGSRAGLDFGLFLSLNADDTLSLLPGFSELPESFDPRLENHDDRRPLSFRDNRECFESSCGVPFCGVCTFDGESETGLCGITLIAGAGFEPLVWGVVGR